MVSVDSIVPRGVEQRPFDSIVGVGDERIESYRVSGVSFLFSSSYPRKGPCHTRTIQDTAEGSRMGGSALAHPLNKTVRDPSTLNVPTIIGIKNSQRSFF
jgi:hypothetical protein